MLLITFLDTCGTRCVVDALCQRGDDHSLVLEGKIQIFFFPKRCVILKGKKSSYTIPRYNRFSKTLGLENGLILACMLTCGTVTTFSALP